MNEMQRMEIERACTRLIYACAQAIDDGDFETAAACFAEDARRTIGDRTVQGRAEIRARLTAAGAGVVTCHIYSNVLVEVHDERQATGTSYVSWWRARARATEGQFVTGVAPAAVARQVDRFVATPEGWKFAARRTIPRFIDPSSFPNMRGAGASGGRFAGGPPGRFR